jgi:hypothetical protein
MLKARPADNWNEYIKERNMKGADIMNTIHDLLYYDRWLVLRVNQGGAGFEDKNGRERYVRFAYWSCLGHEYKRADGIADLLAFKGGVLLGVEVKGDGDVVREGQVSFLDAVRDAGGIPILAENGTAVDEWLSDKVMVQ